MLWMTTALASGVLGVDCPAKEVAVQGLEGVKVRFPAQPCAFRRDHEPTPIRWEIVIDEAPGALINHAERCYSVGEAGFVLVQKVVQGAKVYEPWDHGKCATIPQQPSEPTHGVHAGSFSWAPNAWSGSSCTGNDLGAAMDTGEASYTLSFSGTRDGKPFSVEAAWPLELK